MSAENKCEKQILHHQSHVIGLHMSQWNLECHKYQSQILVYLFIYCDQDIPVGLKKRHHTLFANDIIAYMYGQLYQAIKSTTCMISTILQYGTEMSDIIANNIFHKKLVSRHVNQVGKRHLEQSTHHVYMQFILITKHKHMYINSRIIQIKQKRYFPFFSFFVNRYDIICILIPESYKQMFVFPFFPC